MQHMLEQARLHCVGVGSSHYLHQLVIIVADGRFHEREREITTHPTRKVDLGPDLQPGGSRPGDRTCRQ